MKSKIQNSMDLLQNVYILKPSTGVYILKPHPESDVFLILYICNFVNEFSHFSIDTTRKSNVYNVTSIRLWISATAQQLPCMHQLCVPLKPIFCQNTPIWEVSRLAASWLTIFYKNIYHRIAVDSDHFLFESKH